VEDAYALNPQYREQIYESIRKDNWATQDDGKEEEGEIHQVKGH
jgi:hypothetical protein